MNTWGREEIKIMNWHRKIKPQLWLVFILLFGILLRTAFFSGYVAGDDKQYLQQAYKLSRVGFTCGGLFPTDPRDINHWATRLGIVFPTAFFFYLFGINEISLVLFPLLCSIGSIVIIYYLGKLLFSVKIGLISAFLLSFFPLEVIYGTHLFPTVCVTFFTGLSIFLFLKAEIDKRKLYYLSAGLMIGIGYLCWIGSLFIIFFFLCYIIYIKRIKIGYLLVCSGVLLVFVGEFLFFYYQTGDGFYRYNILKEVVISEGNLNLQTHLIELFKGNVYQGINWFIEPLIMFAFEQEFGFFYYFIWPIVIYFLFKRENNINILILWLIPVTLYLLYGSVSPSNYDPLRRLCRYYSIVTIPGLLILGYFMVTKMKKRLFFYSALIFLLISSIGFVYIDESRNIDYIYRQIYTFHKEHPKDKLYVMGEAYISSLFYSKFQKRSDNNLILFRPEEPLLTRPKIVKEYPNTSFSLEGVHNAYVAVDKEFWKYIPANSKLLKVIQKPKRAYYSIFERGFLKGLWEKRKAKGKSPKDTIIYIYYLY